MRANPDRRSQFRGGRRQTDYPHATRDRYQLGCGCLLCRAANARYEALRAKARAQGQWNGWIDASPARAKLLTLQTEGIGIRQAAKLSGLSVSFLQAIRNGTQVKLRMLAYAKILAIRPVLADGVLVNAWQTKRWLRSLIDAEDFTLPQLAQTLDLPRLLTISDTRRIPAKLQHRVEAFYHQQVDEPS